MILATSSFPVAVFCIGQRARIWGMTGEQCRQDIRGAGESLSLRFPTASVGAIQFYFRLVAVHDRYYLMVCTARALKGAPVVIRLVSRFNGDKEHRDAASGASPRTKRSLFSSKAVSLRHRYSPTNSKLVPGSEAVEAVSSHRSI
jgi:hypothetical protein